MSSFKTASYTKDLDISKKRTRKIVAVVDRGAEDPPQKLEKCYGVLRCCRTECSAKHWKRDVNVAINMLVLLKSELRG